jgi:membrane-associated phospholipid phosphatase
MAGAVPLPRDHHSLRPSGRTQLALFLAAYVIYDLARWLAAGELGPATRNAHAIVDFERGSGIFVERSVQQACDGAVVSWLLANVYLAAQLVVLPGSLLVLYRWSPAIYRRLRDTILATWMLAIPIYAAYPVAPPRLAGIGLHDSVGAQAGVALTGRSTMFFNPLAAVPSLHCGFAFAIGVACAAAARRPVLRALALAWGPLVSLAVVATGNHYLFDIAAGLLVSLAGYLIARSLRPKATHDPDRSDRRPAGVLRWAGSHP